MPTLFSVILTLVHKKAGEQIFLNSAQCLHKIMVKSINIRLFLKKIHNPPTEEISATKRGGGLSKECLKFVQDA